MASVQRTPFTLASTGAGLAVGLCMLLGSCTSSGWGVAVTPAEVAIQIDGELVPYADGGIWMDVTDYDWRGVDVRAQAEESDRLFISNGRVWSALNPSQFDQGYEETEDGVEWIYWGYEAYREGCVTRSSRCVRDLRIAIEPRLQRDVEDRLWDDDPDNWLETQLRLPRSSSGMVYDEQSGDLVMPTLLITIDNTDAANPVVDVVQAERRTAANY